MNSVKKSVWAGAVLALALVIPALPARANVIVDPSFESATAPSPLPGLAGVVSPVFTPGFWGAEFGTVVAAENNVTPWCDSQMLRMENEGGVVTQAFQAVYVGDDSVCIDSGLARIRARAFLNTIEMGGAIPVDGGVTLFFYSCDTCWGNTVPYITTPISLDNNPSTWEPSAVAGLIPPGTRWVLVQLGFTDATLLGRPGYADCVEMEIDTSSCTSTPAENTSWGQVKELFR